MTKQLATELLKLIEDSKHFAIEQMPDVVTQYVAAQTKIVTMYIWIFGMISIILFIIFAICILYKIAENETELIIPSIFVSIIIFIFPFLFYLYNIEKKIMITTGTKAFILEWLSSFIK